MVNPHQTTIWEYILFLFPGIEKANPSSWLVVAG